MTKKTLIYTTNDLVSESAKSCADILYESSLKKNNQEEFDFIIMTNNPSGHHEKHQVILDTDWPFNYAGFLKYSTRIPSGYDYYLYLDSDIIFWDEIDSTIPSAGKIASIAMEYPEEPPTKDRPNRKICMYDCEWHRYQFTEQHMLEKVKSLPCINAGQFGFTDMTFLDRVRGVLLSNINIESRLSGMGYAMYEQTSFNYACAKSWELMDTTKLSDRLTVWPEYDYDFKTEGKTIFHFTGFVHDSLVSKNNRMINYINRINEREGGH